MSPMPGTEQSPPPAGDTPTVSWPGSGRDSGPGRPVRGRGAREGAGSDNAGGVISGQPCASRHGARPAPWRDGGGVAASGKQQRSAAAPAATASFRWQSPHRGGYRILSIGGLSSGVRVGRLWRRRLSLARWSVLSGVLAVARCRQACAARRLGRLELRQPPSPAPGTPVVPAVRRRLLVASRPPVRPAPPVDDSPPEPRSSAGDGTGTSPDLALVGFVSSQWRSSSEMRSTMIRPARPSRSRKTHSPLPILRSTAACSSETSTPEQRQHVGDLGPLGRAEREYGRDAVRHLLVEQVTGVLRDQDQRGVP